MTIQPSPRPLAAPPPGPQGAGAIERGGLRAREAEGARDLAACLALRRAAFRDDAADDADEHDALCRHALVEDARSAQVLATFRLLPIEDGAQVPSSYSARFYDLRALEAFGGRMAEMGRFCVRPGLRDADVLRLAWGLLARRVEADRVALLFGCSSFRGTEADAHRDAFALLRARHLAPPRWRPLVKAREVVRYAARLRRPPDPRRAHAAMPPMLRAYLGLGGWVSDHAVVDRDLGTLHVFTGLEVARIPPARARALRAAAAG